MKDTTRITRMRQFSLGRVIFWILLLLPAWAFGWLESKTFISLVSIYALVETAWAAYRADDNPDAERMERLEKKLDALLEAQATVIEHMIPAKPQPKPRTRAQRSSSKV